MINRPRRTARFITPLLVFSLAQFYVQASLTTGSNQTQNTPTQAVPMIGRLEVHQGKYIRVENNDTESGSTILDGQTLETSDCKSATVHLLPVGVLNPAAGELGQVDLASQTRAVINYTAGKVLVTLIRGCARVKRISDGIDARIESPDGSSMRATQPDPDMPGRTRAENCYPVGEKKDYRPACAAPIIFGLGGAGALIGLALIPPCVRGQDTSPVTPGGTCQ